MYGSRYIGNRNKHNNNNNENSSRRIQWVSSTFPTDPGRGVYRYGNKNARHGARALRYRNTPITLSYVDLLLFYYITYNILYISS